MQALELDFIQTDQKPQSREWSRIQQDQDNALHVQRTFMTQFLLQMNSDCDR